MNEFVDIHGDQWKLEDIRENIEWSRRQVWELREFDKPEGHAHCLICYWTIHKSANSEEGSGYFYGGSTWLCTECYSKFVASHGRPPR
jgi:transposase-like protein